MRSRSIGVAVPDIQIRGEKTIKKRQKTLAFLPPCAIIKIINR